MPLCVLQPAQKCMLDADHSCIVHVGMFAYTRTGNCMLMVCTFILEWNVEFKQLNADIKHSQSAEFGLHAIIRSQYFAMWALVMGPGFYPEKVENLSACMYIREF